MRPIRDPVTDQLLYPFSYPGKVVDNEDPRGLHRIRASIPGLIEKTAWAFPRTMGGGSPQRGGHVVPAVDGDVIIDFLGGDVESPVYTGGWWGEPTDGSEMPTLAKDNKANAHKIQVLQIGQYQITVDERGGEGKGKLTIEDTINGDGIHMDGEKGAMEIRASSVLILKADGLVDIVGGQVQLNGRIIRPSAAGL